MSSIKERNKVFNELAHREKILTVSSACHEAKILREFENEGLIKITEIDQINPYGPFQWRIERMF